jgi:hypothetical protein
MLGTKVFLELFVKTQPEWRNSASMVKQMDWRRQMEQMGEIAIEEEDER